jgi:hypothetical protein
VVRRCEKSSEKEESKIIFARFENRLEFINLSFSVLDNYSKSVFIIKFDL